MHLFHILLISLIAFSFQCLCYPGEYSSVADPDAVVIDGNVRFTLLTERIIRIEYSPSKIFEDAASMRIINRKLPVPQFRYTQEQGALKISTKYVEITYTGQGKERPSKSNLNAKIFYDDKEFSWYPGRYDDRNLFGTVRTLDDRFKKVNLNCSTNPLADRLYCTDGIISLNGWTVIDDTQAVLLDDSKTVPWLLGRNSTDAMDYYLLAFGFDYKAAVSEFQLISGKVPLPPKFAFGVMYSRWWPYGNSEQREIVSEFELNATPLDVLVLDMDWHLTFYKEALHGELDQAGLRLGWSGFTFDTRRYPDHQRFFEWLGSKGIKSTMNLHPASGIQPFEGCYRDFCKAVGIDPESGIYSPYNLTDANWAKAFHEIVLNPLEDSGVNFWWLDWQQWLTGFPNPTIWLNHDFFLANNRRNNNNRKIILHRFGGLGNHRYPIGFSGDVVPDWAALDFQPYFTATAANVLFSYWSHDIGGFILPSAPQIYTRWLQWGIFSPIVRTHSSRSTNNDRRIWKYDYEYNKIMKDTLRMRIEMVPYIYSQAYSTYVTGLAFLHPLYYEYPNVKEAYTFKNEYFFGNDMIVNPITIDRNAGTELVEQSIYIPEGTWVEYKTGEPFTGPQIINRTYTLNEIPAFVRAGAILPLLPLETSLIGKAQKEYSELTYTVYAGGSKTPVSSFLYEDDGSTENYEKGEYSITNMTYYVSGKTIELKVVPSSESKGYSTHTKTRKNNFRIVGVSVPSKVTVNGRSLKQVTFNERPGEIQPNEDTYAYDGSTLTVTIKLSELSSSESITIDIALSSELKKYERFTRCIQRLLASKERLDGKFFRGVFDEDYSVLLDTTEVGDRISSNPSILDSELLQFYKNITETINVLDNNSKIPKEIKGVIINQIKTC